jgi:hypothetical protein
MSSFVVGYWLLVIGYWLLVIAGRGNPAPTRLLPKKLMADN